jgi:hypothetical protein
MASFWFIICIMLPLGILVFGITLLSQNLNAAKSKLAGKCYSWRPKGSVVLTKEKWAQIENSIAAELETARKAGVTAGRKLMLAELENKITEKSSIKNPYVILGLKYQTINKLEERVSSLKSIYDPENFKHLDSDFTLLAEIRIKEIEEAGRKLRNQMESKGLI